MFFFRVIILHGYDFNVQNLISQKIFLYTFRFVIILHRYDLSKRFNNVIDRDIKTNFIIILRGYDNNQLSCCAVSITYYTDMNER